MDKVLNIRNEIINQKCGEHFIEWNLYDELLKTIKEIKNEGLFNKYFMSYSIEYHDEYIKLNLYSSIDY